MDTEACRVVNMEWADAGVGEVGGGDVSLLEATSGSVDVETGAMLIGAAVEVSWDIGSLELVKLLACTNIM